MGKKKNKSNAQKTNENPNGNESEKEKENENENQKKENGDGENKKEASPNSAVFKIDMHCNGCVSKILKSVRGFEGVETVRAELETNKLTVVGKVDPTSLRDKLELKLNKKVELISPQPKKDNKGGEKSDQKPEKKADDKKSKEAPVTTAVLKMGLHCQGCVDKIQKIILKTKGVQGLELDKQKEMLTVKGTMDAKTLAQNLKEKFKRPVEIVPPKKKEGEDEKDNSGGGGGKKKGGGGDGGGQEEGGGGGGITKVEGNKMLMPQPGYGYAYAYGYPQGQAYGNGYGYAYGYGHEYGGYTGGSMHAPQMFSDENPNACSIM